MNTTSRTHESIAVGVDGSLCSHAALRWAIQHARAGDRVTLVHAWEPSPSTSSSGLVSSEDDSGAHHLVQHELARAGNLTPAKGVELSCEVLHGDPRRMLCDYRADLIVIGAGGHGPLAAAVLGSVSAHLARHCTVPLVLVPQNRPRRIS
ncbi:MAG: universal stress protein [Acidimicrobiales bacterium]